MSKEPLIIQYLPKQAVKGIYITGMSGSPIHGIKLAPDDSKTPEIEVTDYFMQQYDVKTPGYYMIPQDGDPFWLSPEELQERYNQVFQPENDKRAEIELNCESIRMHKNSFSLILSGKKEDLPDFPLREFPYVGEKVIVISNHERNPTVKNTD